MGYYNTDRKEVKRGKIASGALNYRAIPNVVGGYLIVWGAWTAITCGINYVALPIMFIGLFMYSTSRELL